MKRRDARNYLVLSSRPAWDRDGGIWYVSPTVPKDKPTPLYRHYPSINALCEPLLGASLYSVVQQKVVLASGEETFEQKYKIVGVRYPARRRRLAIYREALELILVKRDKSDFFNLAIYRRQVTKTTDIPLDDLFLIIGDLLDISRESWASIAMRMPRGTEVHKACLYRAKKGRPSRKKKT